MKGFLTKDHNESWIVRTDAGEEIPLHYDDNKTDQLVGGRVEYTIVSETRMWGIKRYAKLDPNVKLGNMIPQERTEELIERFIPYVRWKMSQEDVRERAEGCARVATDEVMKGVRSLRFLLFDIDELLADLECTAHEENVKQITKIRGRIKREL